MSARNVIEHALRVYYADSRDAKSVVGRLLEMYDAERDEAREKSIPPTVDADFFQPGHTYQRRRWQFQCLAVAPDPFDGENRAVGFLYRHGENATELGLGPDNWAHDGWAAVTGDGAE